jgi:hypothetical protein
MVLGRILAVSVISAVLDMILHALLAPTYTYDYPPSFFVQSGLFKPAAGIALLVIFALLSVVFVFIQENLPGSRVSKGPAVRRFIRGIMAYRRPRHEHIL